MMKNCSTLLSRARSTLLSFDELSTKLNVEGESLNEGSEIKDTIFAMAAVATPKPNNNGFNPSSNRGRVTTIIEVADVEEDHLANLLNLLISISFSKFSLILMELGQKDQFVRYVERLVTQHLIVTIGWTMLIRESILLPYLQLWPLHQMLVSPKINLGLLIVL